MHSRERSRLLGAGIMLVVACTLALAACNSGSVSGSSQNARGANTVTGPESPASAKTPAKGTLAEALIRKAKGAQ